MRPDETLSEWQRPGETSREFLDRSSSDLNNVAGALSEALQPGGLIPVVRMAKHSLGAVDAYHKAVVTIFGDGSRVGMGDQGDLATRLRIVAWLCLREASAELGVEVPEGIRSTATFEERRPWYQAISDRIDSDEANPAVNVELLEESSDHEHLEADERDCLDHADEIHARWSTWRASDRVQRLAEQLGQPERITDPDTQPAELQTAGNSEYQNQASITEDGIAKLAELIVEQIGNRPDTKPDPGRTTPDASAEVPLASLAELLEIDGDIAESDPEPPTPQLWDFQPGVFYFRGRPYELLGLPLECLRVFVNNPRTTYFEPKNFVGIWEDPPRGLENAVKTHLKKLRAKLRQVATDLDYPADCVSNPIPHKKGAGYGFLLERR